MATTSETQRRKIDSRTRKAYRSRIEELREYGEEDGVTISPASEKDFWAFVKSLPAARDGALFLMENGNFRLVWQGSDESHLGLQFLGDRIVEYVIFKRRKRARKVSRVAGADTFDGVRRQIEGFELNILTEW